MFLAQFYMISMVVFLYIVVLSKDQNVLANAYYQLFNVQSDHS